MSGLAGLIAGHHAPGVLRWVNAADVADLRTAVEGAGLRFAHIDGWTADADRRAVLARIGEAFGFPDYFGVNLDALADCLADLAEPVIVVWDGWSVLAEEDADGFAAITEVFAERAPRAPYVSLLLRTNRAGSEDALGRGLGELT